MMAMFIALLALSLALNIAMCIIMWRRRPEPTPKHVHQGLERLFDDGKDYRQFADRYPPRIR